MSEDALFYVFLFLAATIYLSSLFDTFRISWLHFSAVMISLGVSFGGVVRLLYPDEDLTGLKFEDQVFFHAVLPIIIFCAGYGLDVKTFFSNFRSILLIGLVGTVLLWLGLSYTAMLMVSKGWARDLSNMDCLVLGAVIASTDTVAVVALLDPEAVPTLYCILAGEGMANDGIAVVLFRAVSNIAADLVEFGGPEEDKSVTWGLMGDLTVEFIKVLVLSVALGVATGFVSAFCAKWNRARPPHDVEIILVFLFGFISYFVAEMVDCSGIISIFVCGIVQSQYTVLNISPAAQFTSYHSLNTFSYAMEALIFTVLGFYMWSYIGDDFSFTEVDGTVQDIQLAAGMFLSLFVCRVILVFTLIGLGNRGKKGERKLTFTQYLGIVYAGLLRGVIAFALSQSIESRDKGHKDGMVTTTYILVMVTTLIGGCLSKPFFMCLGIPTDSADSSNNNNTNVIVPNIADNDLGASAAGLPPVPLDTMRRSQGRSARRVSQMFGHTYGTLDASLGRTVGGGGGGGGVSRVNRLQLSRVHSAIYASSEPGGEDESRFGRIRDRLLGLVSALDRTVLQPAFGLTPAERERMEANTVSAPLVAKVPEPPAENTFPQIIHSDPPGENPFKPH